MMQTVRTTVDQNEIEHFSRMAEEWWDPQGKFRPLHQFNPVRLTCIKEKICKELDRNPIDVKPLKGLKILDIGCGGGLLCEPLVRLGADVVGIDASSANIEVARTHANAGALEIDYRVVTAEALSREEEKFDVILNMEVIEHVADTDLFIATASSMVKPGGLMFVATLNRTWKAWGLAIIGAEYILRWLPRGTHHYKRFLRPHELKQKLSAAGLAVIDETGIIYNPLEGEWKRSPDMSVNYMLLARYLSAQE